MCSGSNPSEGVRTIDSLLFPLFKSTPNYKLNAPVPHSLVEMRQGLRYTADWGLYSYSRGMRTTCLDRLLHLLGVQMLCQCYPSRPLRPRPLPRRRRWESAERIELDCTQSPGIQRRKSSCPISGRIRSLRALVPSRLKCVESLLSYGSYDNGHARFCISGKRSITISQARISVIFTAFWYVPARLGYSAWLRSRHIIGGLSVVPQAMKNNGLPSTGRSLFSRRSELGCARVYVSVALRYGKLHVSVSL